MPRGYAPAIPSGEITEIVQGGPSLGRSASRGSPRPITTGGSREDEARRRGEVGDDLSTNTVATTVAGAMLAACLVFGSADKTFASELALLIQRGAR
jgi:hypothetical protein